MSTVRLSISIPGDLDRRLDAHRDRINISAVCAAALEAEVVAMEKLAKIKRKDLHEAVRRLQKEREETEDQSRQQGLKHGIDAVKHGGIGYAEIRWFANDAQDRADGVLGMDGPIRERLLGARTSAIAEYAREHEELIRQNETEPSDWESYWQGFADGVLRVWDEIADDVEG